ncbi:16115_t:CDS:1, partial [Acaulospora colombiana]
MPRIMMTIAAIRVKTLVLRNAGMMETSRMIEMTLRIGTTGKKRDPPTGSFILCYCRQRSKGVGVEGEVD